MRYLTNQLGWIHDAFSSSYWTDHQGNSLESRFSFGANHDWQAPIGTTCLFACEPLSIEMARAWITREQFTSLVCGHDSWSEFLQKILNVPVSKFERSEPDQTFHLKKGDVVLRAGYASAAGLPSKWSKRFIEDLPDQELIELLRENPELIRFYLHFILEQRVNVTVKYDAGL